MNTIMIAVAGVGLICLAACGGPEEMVARSASTQPGRVVGLEPGWELAARGEYSAQQVGRVVTITAKGENPTAGYEVKLVQSPLRIWPPQWMLARKRPEWMVAQVITPFEVTASFESDERVRAVKVADAAGRQEVPVEGG